MDIDEIFAPILYVQNIFGHQVLDQNWSWKKNSLKHFFSTLLLLYVAAGTVYFMKNNDDIQLFSEAIVTLMITCQYPIQLSIFAYNRSTLRDIYAFSKNSLFSLIKEISPNKGIYVISLLRKMVKAFFVLNVTATLDFLLKALYFYFFGTRVTLSRTTSILMSMTSPTYEIGLLLHLIYLCMVSFGIMVVDMWFIYLTFILCEASDCAVKILKVKRLENEDDVSYGNRLNGALRKFYTVHVKLMQYLNKLNVIYKWLLLVPMFVVLANTCMLLMVLNEQLNLQLTIIVLIGSTEISAYNILGEKIKSKADDMTIALHNFNWLNLKLTDRKNYHIIMCCMKKDFSVHTAVGIDLSLVTLSSIYKASYQAFAVLNSINH